MHARGKETVKKRHRTERQCRQLAKFFPRHASRGANAAQSMQGEEYRGIARSNAGSTYLLEAHKSLLT